MAAPAAQKTVISRDLVGAKTCIDWVTFESRGNQSAVLRDVGRMWSSLGRLWAKALKTSYDQEILQA